MMVDGNRYVALMREWATRALDDSAGARAFVQTGGPSVTLGAPAARLLLSPHAPAAPARASAAELARLLREHAIGPIKFADTFGFSRPAYYPLLVHLHLAALPEAGDLAEQVAAQADGVAGVPDASLRLWWALCLDEAGEQLQQDAIRRHAAGVVAAVADAPGDAGSLHRREGLDDLLDAWTFRELVGLHALAWMAIRTGNATWARRAAEIAVAHQAVTQPDYTTYQPWGVFAFLFTPETTLFADQQLHDTATNLHVERGGAGLVPGLLLADAAAALDAAGSASRVCSPPESVP